MKKLSASLLAICLAAGLTLTSLDARAQQAFKSPEEAADALIAAARAGDRKVVLGILGAAAQELISSGDPVEDANTRQEFLAAYDAKHTIGRDGDNKAFLVIGNEDWPFPIPMVQANGAWRFDAVAGREEILARRIGRNELSTIQAALAYVDAQNEYAEMQAKAGGPGSYATRIISSPGKKDGLYWPTAQGEPQSPLGEAVAVATSEGYKIGGERIPFHGYYFKILTRQGPTAPGGTLDYMVKGKLIGGFALIAWP